MIVAFVCSGNICRSPLAEAFANSLDVPGFVFVSAGTIAMPGQPASLLTVEVAAELGLDLGPHRARDISELGAIEPQAVFGMEHHHVAAVLRGFPEWEGRVHMLDPTNETIADPYGRSIARYREARDHIAASISARDADWQV